MASKKATEAFGNRNFLKLSWLFLEKGGDEKSFIIGKLFFR